MKLSIITPTLNADRWLVECLESVGRQRDDATLVEHVIVDAGSTDRTLDIVKRFDVRLVEVEEPGIYAQINEGVRQSTGDVVGYLGGDDTLFAGAIKTVGRWYDAGRFPWLVGSLRWMDADGRPLGDQRAPPVWMTTAMYSSLGWSCIPHMTTFLRREFLADVGPFNEDFVSSGDYEYFCRALLRSPFDRASSNLASFRTHDSNISRSTNPGVGREARRVQQVFAPRSAAKRMLYRYSLKVWINAHSPTWFMIKKIPAFRRLVYSGDSQPASKPLGWVKGG